MVYIDNFDFENHENYSIRKWNKLIWIASKSTQTFYMFDIFFNNYLYFYFYFFRMQEFIIEHSYFIPIITQYRWNQKVLGLQQKLDQKLDRNKYNIRNIGLQFFLFEE